MSFAETTLKAAHNLCYGNRKALEASATCGCFYCTKIIPTSDITEWAYERSGQETGLCPSCGVDALFSAGSPYPLTPEFLKVMREYWFSIPKPEPA